MDESNVYIRGQYFYTKVRGNDPHLQRGLVIKENGNDNLLYYNGSYAAILYDLNKAKTYEGYHLVNLLFGSILFIFCYELLLAVYKNPYLAVLGPLFLFFTPRFLGAIPANPKDIPFALFYFVGLSFIFFSRKWDEKWRILVVGACIGIATALRFVGLSLLPIYFLYHIIPPILSTKRFDVRKMFNLVIESFLIFLIAFLVLLVNMPYIGADPFNHFLEFMNLSKTYSSWNENIILLGKAYSPSDRPQSYLFIWLLLTTPVSILALIIVSFFRNVGSLKFLLLISIGLQLILYFILHPVIYNGLRHYLFLLPQLVILACLSFVDLIRNTKYKNVTIIMVAINIVFVAYSYIRLHPYENIYFNALAGGTKGVVGKMELDYWGATDKEGLAWLKNYLQQNVPSNQWKRVNVFACSKSVSLEYYLPEVINVNETPSQADYIVCHNNFTIPEIEKQYNVTLLHIVERNGTPLNYIFKVNKRSKTR
jgi:hypothetical protein